MGLGTAVKEMWERVVGVDAGSSNEGERQTVATALGMNSIFAPFRSVGVQNALPKPTAANLRRFAETPPARRAINCIKDKIACMEWRVEARPGAGDEGADDRTERVAALTRAFDIPNGTDSFRTFIEQVIEDSHLTLTSAGLTMNGGNGFDGQTVLSALDVVEMGGSIVVQLGGVVLGAASDGMLGGMYEGTSILENCFAGFRVRQNSGTTVLVPVVNGAEVGTTFTPMAGHTYALRLRLHCVEMQRVPQRYYCMVDGVIQSFGSASGVAAPMDVVFDLVDEGVASSTPATVLYDSAAVGPAISNTPATCEFVVANSTQLFGSIASVNVSRPGSAWIVSTLPSGATQTRLIGVAGQGADCTVTYGTRTGTTGKVTFFAGRVPAVGERVTVFYRNQQRAVARLADAAIGKVLQPIARSTADCENAAQAVLAFSTSRSAAISGTYALTNPTQDIWPGDVLAVTSEGITSSLLVRGVVAKDSHSQPEVISYELKFENDWAAEWADGIGLRLSEDIAADALLPQTAANAPNQVLANLQQLSVTSLTEAALSLDMGTDPPAGGGFEVRRKDREFGVGVDAADLVLRSPVRSFSIPRAAQVENFFVRMYDAGTPALYSRFSSAVFVNAPVS
jgi:hypothetical protein